MSKGRYEFGVYWINTMHGLRLLIVKNGRKLWLTPREVSKVVTEVLRSGRVNVNVRVVSGGKEKGSR